MVELPTNLARNLRGLRDTRGLTQQQLAERAGIPRPTLATLESGSANPTLQVVVRVASALNVSVEELIGPPRATGRFVPAAELPRRVRGGVEVSTLLPDALPGVQVERLEIPVDRAFPGAPHTPGTREYLYCERGEILLTASGVKFTLTAGDVVVFRGDQRHAYKNVGDTDAVGISVVLLPPRGG